MRKKFVRKLNFILILIGIYWKILSRKMNYILKRSVMSLCGE